MKFLQRILSIVCVIRGRKVTLALSIRATMLMLGVYYTGIDDNADCICLYTGPLMWQLSWDRRTDVAR